jgi:hypothetical protein
MAPIQTILGWKVEAMPQLIPQDDLNDDFVWEWKKTAELALKRRYRLTQQAMQTGDILYHHEKSKTTGVFFLAADGVHVDYLYAYKSINIQGKPTAAEALAYRFSDDVVGVTKEVFFDFLLPYCKFVVTDSVYTPDGHRWFKAQYNWAFGRGMKVFGLDMKEKTFFPINKETFLFFQHSYWGLDNAHQHYRFAIEL